MVEEQKIIFDEKPQDLLKFLMEEGSIDEFDKKGYKINYFGENESSSYLESISKNFPIDGNNINEIQSHLNNTQDTRNYILYIKYKDIYIGGLSIFDFQSKEGFGLYKYINSEENAFYLGQWELNQKSGKGFLKMDNNHLYIGNFKNNQMDGEGLYHNRSTNNFYFGSFNNGVFKKGLYCNLLKDIYYFGEFDNNRKNCQFCCYLNYKENRLFFGQIKNDLFIKGFIGYLKIIENENEISIEIEKIIYYNKNSKDDSKKIILINSNQEFEMAMYNVLQAVDNIKNLFENMKLLDELEEIYNDKSYNNGIGRYNSYENDYSFENDFIENYDYYFNSINEILKVIDLKEIKNNFRK